MQTLIRDSKIKSARELARQQRREQKEESRFGFAKSLLKTGLQFVPGVGKLLSAGVDIIGDPIARSFGAGADADDIKLSGGNLAFGGEQDAKDMRAGLQDYLKSAKEGSISSGLTSLVSYGLDKGLDKKMFDGEFKGDNLQYEKYLDDFLLEGKDGTLLEKVSDSIQDFGGNIQDFGGKASKMIANKGSSIMDYFTSIDAFPHLAKSYEQGGMVQKYENGGQVAYMKRTTPTTYKWDSSSGFNKRVVDMAGETVYDTYTYNGTSWNKTEEGLDALPSGGKLITQKQMDNYRSEQRTQDVSSTYMSDPTEFGIQEILKSPQLYSQVEAARAGNEGALANILEMVRQSRPDLEGSNEALTASIKKILPNIDLYGQGYQDVLAEGATTLKGLTEQATGMRAQEATQRATSGIRRPGAQSNISEGLYSGAEDVYSGMQRGIQGEFDKSFGEFDDMVNLVS